MARGPLEHRNTVENLDWEPPPDGSVSDADHELEIPFYHVFEAPDRVVRNSLPPGHQNRLALAPAGSDIWYAVENGYARPYEEAVFTLVRLRTDELTGVVEAARGDTE